MSNPLFVATYPFDLRCRQASLLVRGSLRVSKSNLDHNLVRDEVAEADFDEPLDGEEGKANKTGNWVTAAGAGKGKAKVRSFGENRDS